MKKAFTMIELIFVIVIISILATIAIPKLTATRDDAKIVALAQAIQTVKFEISTSISATNIIPQTTADMINLSNTARELSDFIVVNNKVINIVDTDTTQVCKVLTIDDSNSSIIKLTLIDGVGTSIICQGIQKLVPNDNSGFILSSNIVKF